MLLPLGHDNFRKLIDYRLDFVDKSLFIQEILDDRGTNVAVITRPRRFGKTLNLSMLHYFLAAEAYGKSTQGLFDGLKIAALGEKYMQHQGQYPVIFLTLKDVRDHSFDIAKEKLGLLLAEVYREHSYLLHSPHLEATDKQFFNTILGGTNQQSLLEKSLASLTRYLFQHYGKSPWLLIDEYDTPMHSAFLHHYYDEMISLIRGLFGAALKSNPYLEKAVITGILRISKESLFSGLNNIQVYTLLQTQYSEYFGFTETEVASLLQEAHLESRSEAIRDWYNGYQCGNTIIYNPWSMVQCIHAQGELRPFWVNTSSNDLIKHLLAQGDATLKANLELLLKGKAIEAVIEETIIFADLARDNNAFWNLMLFSGYLKAISTTRVDDRIKAQLASPNREISSLYRGIIQAWFADSLGYSNYQSFLQSLVQGKVEEFILRLQDCLRTTLSFFDVTGLNPEKFYHGFVLGLMISLQDTYEIQSNKEGGYGRFDVMLIPKDLTQLGIVLEFKTVRDLNTSLTAAAEEALRQIINRDYAQILRSKNIQRILQLGLAFRHKEVAVAATQ